MSGHRRTRIAVAVSAIIASVQFATAAELKDTVALDITAQSLDRALLRFSEQTGIQVLMSTEIVEGKTTRGVRGQLTAEQALQQLLEGSGLQYRSIDQRAVTIAEKVGSVGADANEQAAGNTRIAWVQEGEGTSTTSNQVNKTASRASPADGGSAEQKPALEEVVVTGSHIRGADNLSSPVISFDREAIAASGYSTTQQFIRSLPQNLSNVADTTFSAANGGPVGVSSYGGTGINLRGLGSDSTLVLLNGRRLAAAGSGAFVDISLIPLSAIERIDVLADGASATYGSDAVGGVVNFIVRKDFEGAETRIRFGTVTEGSHDEIQAGQMYGHSWNSGQALVSYEYYRRTPLDGADREFIKLNQSIPEYDAIPGQRRHSALVHISQRIADHAELSSDLFFSQRESAYSYMSGPTSSMLFDSRIKQYGGSAALSIDLAKEWQVRLSGLIDQSDSDEELTMNRAPCTESANKSRIWSVDLAGDGSLGNAPGGSVRLAIGAQFRNEQFAALSVANPQRPDRNIVSAFAEMRVPWVGAANRRAGVRRLELTLAGRFEDYSDFGSTFNPKVGLAWEPVSGAVLRSTWGTSFKAPLFSKMDRWIRRIVARMSIRTCSSIRQV